MEKVVTLLWVLVAVGAFIFRIVMKMRDTVARESQERPARPDANVPGLPTATFQEMLRQMQSRNAQPEGVPAQPGPAPAPPAVVPGPRTLGGRPMPREVARPARSQERTTVRQTSLEAPATARARYAPALPARRSSTLPRASFEAPTPVLHPTPGKQVDSAAPTSDSLRRLLSNPESMRVAFVLSEVLQRKY
ncbi:MAG TPA: hypothetical protein VF629_21275 [Hymenobacter sp.]|jgi:hypothetical protein|uniref:hypothetical protein n=1 Tax=Hymenobacter sp. TaxID=1898978 RepID=UPI002ED9BE4C